MRRRGSSLPAADDASESRLTSIPNVDSDACCDGNEVSVAIVRVNLGARHCCWMDFISQIRSGKPSSKGHLQKQDPSQAEKTGARPLRSSSYSGDLSTPL